MFAFFILLRPALYPAKQPSPVNTVNTPAVHQQATVSSRFEEALPLKQPPEVQAGISLGVWLQARIGIPLYPEDVQGASPSIPGSPKQTPLRSDGIHPNH